MTFSPEGVSAPTLAPAAAGPVAVYPNLWPGTDLTEQAISTGVVEKLILTGPDVPTAFTYDVAGAAVRAEDGGGLTLTAKGREFGVVPAPTVWSRASSGSSGLDVTSSSGVRLAVLGMNRLEVSISARWLRSLPASAFPVVIDPSYETAVTHPSSANTISLSPTHAELTGVMQAGIDSAGNHWEGAVYLPAPPASSLPAPPSGDTPWQLVSEGVEFATTQGGAPDQAYYDGSSQPTYASIPAGVQETVLPYYTFFPPYPSGAAGGWFGLTSTGATAGQLDVVPYSDVSALFQYSDPPPATAVSSPAAGAVVASTTPTLTAPLTEPNLCTGPDYQITGNQNCDFPSQIYYDFTVSTSPTGANGQTVADSGWQQTPYVHNSDGSETPKPPLSWRVPPGSLIDGVHYYATVQENLYVPGTDGATVPAAGKPVAFEVKERLDAGGPSPTDTVGSPPSGTSTPSVGAPNPGTSPSSETVDLVTGNLALAVSSQQLTTLSGPAGVTLHYNSSQASTSTSSLIGGANYGLLGQYYTTTSVTSSHAFPSGLPNGQRVDPTINFDTGSFEQPIGGLTPNTPLLARWTGQLTLPPTSAVPAGTTFEIGGASTGGIQVLLNGSSTATYSDNWSSTSPGSGAVTFETATKLTPGTSEQIQVQDWDPGNGAELGQLWAQELIPASGGNAAQSIPMIIPSTWLTPAATGLPPGWSISAATASWSRATDLGNQVVLHSPTGETATFTRNADGSYLPQPGDTDALSLSGGHLQLSSTDGYLYVFNSDGTLASMTSAANDLKPDALVYGYAPTSGAAGAPIVLTTITDPVSARSIDLSYGGQSGCPAGNGAPAGMLCHIDYWDGTATDFTYNSNNQLAKIVSPGGVTTLVGYNSDNQINDIRDALANDYLAAGLPGTSGCTAGTAGGSCPLDTVISYDSSGRVATITQPAPTPGAARPARTYTYQPSNTDPGAGTTGVSIAGFTPAAHGDLAAGQAASVTYDDQSRVTARTNSTGLTSHTVWDDNDQPIINVDSAAEQTSNVYDLQGNLTDSYGPAPLACFTAGSANPWPTNTSYASPPAPILGYLPVSDPTGTAGCATAVPHTHNGYDENIQGLAATYWPNADYAGTPTLHATGTGIAPTANVACPGSTSGTTSNALCGSWPAGTAPGGTDASGKWTTRLTGLVDVVAAGAYEFRGTDTLPLTVYIDGTLVGTNVAYTATGAVQTVAPSFDNTILLALGWHTMEVDFQGSSAAVTSYTVAAGYVPNNQTPIAIPFAALSPGYGLNTSVTDPDGDVTVTAYTASGFDAAYGLPTATATGYGTSAQLTSYIGYETPGTGYLRKTATSLPAGTITTYQYYGGQQDLTAATCGVSTTVSQAGLLAAEIDPAPTSGAAAREQQYVYDADGRQVGTRIGTTASISNVGWNCTSYDARGRIVQQTWPSANLLQPTPTVTYTYAVGGNPLVTSVADNRDSNAAVTSTVDLLGRAVSYTDSLGDTTTSGYDQAGQLTGTDGPQGTITDSYDPNTAQLTTVALGGTVLATAGYDSAARLDHVAYASHTQAAIGYDANGRQNSLVFTNTDTGALITGDQITDSPAGRITGELQDINGALTNPGGQGAVDYTYDPSGRLLTADLPGETASYSYAANPTSDNCGWTGAGQNTNRTAVTVTATGGTPVRTDYCYNGFDQLVSSISNAGTPQATTSTSYAYDASGNQTTDGGATLTYDAANRLTAATTGSLFTQQTTSYVYDALNRVVQRTIGGTATSYGYAGFTDQPALTKSGSTTVAFVALPGGVTDAIQTTGTTSTSVWAYPDLHGNNAATTDANGTPIGSTTAYDPWGTPLTNPVVTGNAAVTGSFTSYGAHGKITDTSTGLTILGARPYDAAQARFLTVDPVHGGCANPYTYVFGDPINHQDLGGQGRCSGGRFNSDGLAGSCGFGIVSAGCWVAISPTEAKRIISTLTSGLGTAAVEAVAYAICGGVGQVGTPALGAAAGAACAVLAHAGALQLEDWLQAGVDWGQATVFELHVSLIPAMPFEVTYRKVLSCS